jgi:two-component system chemotaxis response regulator CheY
MQAKVLVVDDSMVARLAVKAALRESDVAFTEASSGEEALELVDGGFRPDIVFLDLTMPGMGGIEALKGLKARIGDIRVIVVTADIQARTVAEVRSIGAYEILRKPPDKKQTAEVFAKALAGEPAS